MVDLAAQTLLWWIVWDEKKLLALSSREQFPNHWQAKNLAMSKISHISNAMMQSFSFIFTAHQGQDDNHSLTLMSSLETSSVKSSHISISKKCDYSQFFHAFGENNFLHLQFFHGFSWWPMTFPFWWSEPMICCLWLIAQMSTWICEFWNLLLMLTFFFFFQQKLWTFLHWDLGQSNGGPVCVVTSSCIHSGLADSIFLFVTFPMMLCWSKVIMR